ncbi:MULTISPECIES: TAXI family TRAP transporter solute-binding subunit [unclassified Ruegeria]|uniref:TAXI family TRAP transporter solute-binding subunit n=1 Tax=unclassified Ruegeria TaxID=2625375 RepID=UPI001ADCC51C|nr:MULTISPECIES: TAXI family TRAP transporter solute-binding subunit [unclassified Ruegeria]MBO9410983.1 TAXI family TRAP transporter solute-binding subunit [Ruegeria sp. R8_1]MBO9415184.1 TAXI family TRAP transporter solute-binding subunit [Ruegeria sp. R8_2]
MTKRLFAIFLGITLFFPGFLAAQDVRVFSIGSGNVSGNYFPVASAICDVFNMRDDSLRRCSPEPTPGSVYNLKMMHSGELDFAIVQSDWQQAAFEGTTLFAKDGAMDDLRVITPLFKEAVTILAAPNSGIRTIRDLRGKAVDIGRSASGRNASIRNFLDEMGQGLDLFGTTYELEPSNALQELCEGRIDASIFILGHPNQLIGQALDTCEATMVSVAGPGISEFLNQNPVYQAATIDMELYGKPGRQIPTISVVAALVAREGVESNLVADLADGIENAHQKLTADLPVLDAGFLKNPAAQKMPVPEHPGVSLVQN